MTQRLRRHKSPLALGLAVLACALLWFWTLPHHQIPPAHAQGVGILQRASCDTITSPVTGQTWCFDQTARVLKVWNGSSWATTTLSNNGATGFAGLYSIASCTSVNSPIIGQSFCFENSSNALKFWNGTSWTLGGGGITFDVRSFGADPTGTIDSTTGIQAAINAATATAVNGGAVYVPAGLYKVSSQINVQNGRFIRIYGDGVTSILRWTPATGNSAIIRVDGQGPAGTSWFQIEGLQLDSQTVQPAGLSGLTFASAGGLVYNATIRNMVFNHLATGSVVNNQADEFVWQNNWWTSTARGVYQQTPAACASGCTASNHLFEGNHFQNHSDWAIDFQRSNRFTFIGNTVQSDTAGAQGVRVDASANPAFINNYFEWQTNPTGTAISINPTTAGGDSLGAGIIQGNLVNLNNAATGVLVANIAGLRVGTNTFRLVTTAITIASTASLVTVEPQSAGTGVGTMLTDNRVDNGNLTNAESRYDALRVRGNLTVLNPVTITSTLTPSITMNGTTASGQYITMTNTGANLQLGIDAATGGSLLTGTAPNATVLNTGNATQIAFGTNNALRGYWGASGGLVATSSAANASADKGIGTFNFASAIFANGRPYSVASGVGTNLASIRGISASSSLSNNLRGTCTFAAAATCVVAFANNEPDSDYFIPAVSCSAAAAANVHPVSWQGKTRAGFTLQASVSNSNACDWMILR